MTGETFVIVGANLTGGAADGSLSFNAADSQTGSEHLGVVTVTGGASIDVSSATIRAGNIDLEASSALAPASARCGESRRPRRCWRRPASVM